MSSAGPDLRERAPPQPGHHGEAEEVAEVEQQDDGRAVVARGGRANERVPAGLQEEQADEESPGDGQNTAPGGM